MATFKYPVDETTKILDREANRVLHDNNYNCVRIEYNKTQTLKQHETETDPDSDTQNHVLTSYGVSNYCQENGKAVKKISDEDAESGNASKKRKFILILCAIAYLLCGMAYSNIAPFYPKEAEIKGMSLTLTGFVFSIFEFLIFVSSPFVGKYITAVGARFAFMSGIFVGGVCTILFGTLSKCPPGLPFITLSFLCRGIEALGFSCFITTIMTIVSCEFPNYVATTLALLETSNGIGTMVGPAIGGVLYELGGFGLPFYTIGTLILVNGFFIYLVFPSPQITVNQNKMSMFFLLRNPMVVIPMISMCLGATTVTFVQPTLAKHLDPFGLSTAIVGLIFVIIPAMYAGFTVFWGYLIDKKGIQCLLVFLGHMTCAFGMFIEGPTNLFSFVPFKLWTVIIGLFLVGVSYSCLSIPPLKCIFVGAVELGFKEDIDMYSSLTGLINAMYYLGACLGPVIGGAMIQELGFATGYTIMGIVHIVLAIVTFFFFFAHHPKKKQRSWSLSSEEENHNLLAQYDE